LCVDELYDTEEIVVKPLSRHIEKCRCFAGATIMGNGRVAMILDAAGIAEHAKLRFDELAAEELQRQERERQRRSLAAAKQSIIIFNNAPDEYFALPLARISRLEKIDSAIVQRIGAREFVPHRSGALPLVRLEHFLPVRPPLPEARECYLIIPKSAGPPWGIVATAIVDTVDAEIELRADNSNSGFIGSAMVQSHLTFFLDVDRLLAAAPGIVEH